MTTLPISQQEVLVENGGLDSEWRELLEHLLSQGRSAGADLVEIFLERNDNVGLLVEQDLVTSVTP